MARGEDGAEETDLYTYKAAPKDDMVETILYADGSWVYYEYEYETVAGSESRRTTKEVRGLGDQAFPGSTAPTSGDITAYSYTADQSSPDDNLARYADHVRKTVRTKGTTEVSRDYNAYYVDAVDSTLDVHEHVQAVRPGALYTDQDNRVTKTWSYNSSVGDVTIEGRTVKVERFDGKVTLYDYADGDLAETVPADGSAPTYVFTENVEGKALKTITTNQRFAAGSVDGDTRSISYSDAQSVTLKQENEVYVDGDWRSTDDVLYAKDDVGRIYKTWRSNGTWEEKTYACCGLDRIEKSDGSVVRYLYSTGGSQTHQLTASPNGNTVVSESVDTGHNSAVTSGRRSESYRYIIEKDIDTVTLADCNAATKTLESATNYDLQGRTIETVNKLGIRTQYAYDGLKTTVSHNADASGTADYTTESETYLDGRAKKETRTIGNTAVVLSYSEYGTDPLNNETVQFTKTWQGDSSAAAYSKSWTDALGRTVKTERPAYGGGLLETTSSYHDDGSLAQSSATDQIDIYHSEEYTNGELIRLQYQYESAPGVPDLTKGRISKTVQSYEWDAGIAYRVVKQYGFMTDNNSSETLLSTQKTRLSELGFDGFDYMLSESYGIDTHGNSTRSRRYLWADTKIVDETYLTYNNEQGGTTTDLISLRNTQHGVLQRSQDRYGAVTTFTYDDWGRRTGSSTTSGSGADQRVTTSKAGFNDLGQLVQTEDSMNIPTWYVYDELGRSYATVSVLTNSNPVANLAAPEITASGDDPLSDYVSDTDHYAVTFTQYDALGQRIAQWGATYPVAYAYDDRGRKTDMWTLRDKDGTIAPQLTASADVQSILSATGNGDNTHWQYEPVMGLLEQKEDAEGEGPSYTYTAQGKLKTRTWARNVGTESDPKYIQAVYHYFGEGANEAKTGQLRMVDYRQVNAAGTVVDTDTENTSDIHYTYTRTGQQKSAQNGEAGYGFSYLANGELNEEYVTNTVTVVDANNVETSHDYEYVFTRDSRDNAGRVSGYGLFEGDHNYDIATAPIVQLVNYSYNADGLLDEVSNEGRVFKYKYYNGTSLDKGRILYDNGSTRLDVTRTLEVTRNQVDKIENNWWSGPIETLISSFDYTNDAAGRRVGRDDDGLAFNTTVAIPNTFGYDLKSQVTGATMNNNSDNYAYIYDQIGNRSVARKNGVGIVYEPNELNQYDAISDELTAADGSGLEQADSTTTVEPLFDDDGNMTLNVGQDDDWTYFWNGENRLIKARSPGNKVEFVYDHQGRRIQKKVYSWNPSDYSDPDGEPTVPNHIFVYIYDGWNLVTELEVNSLFITQNSSLFLWGKDLSGSFQGAGGVGGLLMVEKDGQFYYPTFDANGNVSEYVKKGMQATFVADDIVAHYGYDPFGNTTDNYTDTVAFAHRFSTKYLDTETDLYYYGYRYYSPSLGRWLNRDPIEEAGGIHLYVMAYNNLIPSIDPLGRRSRRNWRDRNFWRGWNLSLFDERGKELLGRWLNGEDTDVTLTSEEWVNYMKKNKKLTAQLESRLEKDALERTGPGSVDINFWAEIENGYLTGYEMLHGSNPAEGDFQISGSARYVSYGGMAPKVDGARIEYDLTLTWNDIIDPNPDYPGDIVADWVLRLLYNPQDYSVHIKWNGKPKITRCMGEVQQAKGYPFE